MYSRQGHFHPNLYRHIPPSLPSRPYPNRTSNQDAWFGAAARTTFYQVSLSSSRHYTRNSKASLINHLHSTHFPVLASLRRYSGYASLKGVTNNLSSGSSSIIVARKQNRRQAFSVPCSSPRADPVGSFTVCCILLIDRKTLHQWKMTKQG